MSRISRSFDLFGSSWNVLRRDRELLALPVISGVVSIVVFASFLLPGYLSLDSRTTIDEFGRLTETLEPTVWTYVLGAAFYVVSAFFVIFFNAALVHATNQRLDGGDPTLASALAGAWARRGLILRWAIVSATVSMIIRQIQENGGLIGRLLGGLIGIAWGVVTFLVLPTLVIEGLGVRDALSRSAASVRTTWGENLIGQGGLGLAGVIFSLPILGLGAIGALLLADSVVLGLTIIAAAILALMALVVVLSALGVIYQTALYRFATHGVVEGFPAPALRGAFHPKV